MKRSSALSMGVERNSLIHVYEMSEGAERLRSRAIFIESEATPST